MRLLHVPAQSVFYLLVCGATIVVLLVVGLYPAQISLNRLESEITSLRARLEEQRTLFPIYRELLGKIQIKDPTEIPLPERVPLPADQIDKIPALFREVSQKCDLALLSATPDARSVTNSSQFLMVELVLQGEFLKFRNFLFELQKLSYLEHIEEIQIQSGGREFRLKVWLTVRRAGRQT